MVREKRKVVKKFLSVSIVALLFLSGCDWFTSVRETIEGAGSTVREERPVSYFSEIEAQGMGTIILTQGDQETLTVEAPENILPHIVTKVKGDELRI